MGGIQAGAFKIGDTAGTLENIVESKLYRPGSVGFVSKSVWFFLLIVVKFFQVVILLDYAQNNAFSSNLGLQGGMSNELYRIISRTTDGIYEGIHHVTF